MKAINGILAVFLFLAVNVGLVSCKSARVTVLGVIHYEKQYPPKPSDVLTNRPLAQTPIYGIYKGTGGPGSIYGTIESADSVLIKKAMISFRQQTNTDTIHPWSYLHSDNNGKFVIQDLPAGYYDVLVVNINSTLFAARDLVLSDSTSKVCMNVLLFNVNQ